MLMDSSYRRGPSSVLSYTGLALQSYLRFAEEIVRSAGRRTKPTMRDSGALRHLRIRLPLLRRRNGYECFVEQKIVDDFQCAGHEERNIDPGRPGKHKTHEQGADGSACRSSYAGNSSGGRAFFRTHTAIVYDCLVGTSIWLILKRTRR